MAIFNGTNLSETVTGGATDDTVNGLDGNDTLFGGIGGIDILNGGNGDDFLNIQDGDSGFGGAQNDLLSVQSDNTNVLNGGAGQDTLRLESSYDISGSTISLIEELFINGNVSMTALQLSSFSLVSGYSPASTTAAVTLTQGGTALVTLSATLTNNFSLTGSGEADIISFLEAFPATIFVSSGFGDDVISTASGNDFINGGDGNDTLSGVAGNDSIEGGNGFDSILGGVGNDTLIVRFGDTIDGGDDDDLLSVNENLPAVLIGGLGNDTLRMESSYDITGATISGIEVLAINGAPLLTATQLGSFSLVTGYLPNFLSASLTLTEGGTANVTLSATLTTGFNLTGSNDADILTFNPTHLFTIAAFLGSGNDNVVSGAGNDSLRGDDGNDTLSSLDGNDSLDGGNGLDSLLGGAGDDFLVARTGDTINGGIGNDLVSVTETLPAVLIGGAGIDTLRFESSYDISGATLSGFENLNLNGNVSMTLAQLDSFLLVGGYNSAFTNGTVTLTQGGTAGVVLSATLTNAFNLFGSGQADLITFNAGHLFTINVNAGLGNDSIVSGAGNDSLFGSDGNDTLSGLNGLDSLDGGTGVDSLLGGNGNDFLVARSFDAIFGGNNDDLISVTETLPAVLDGGLGVDTLRFESSYDITGATVTGIENLNLNGQVMMTAAQLNTFTLVSGYSAGSTFAQLTLTQGGIAAVNLAATLTNSFNLTGSAEADLITFNPTHLFTINVAAGLGDDSIVTGSGNDSMWGGDGADTLTGLNGNDTFDGGTGVDAMFGGNGNDFFVVRTGDAAFGGANDDFFSITENAPANINGGTGLDTIRFESSYDISGTTLTAVEQAAINFNAFMTATQLGSFTSIAGYGVGSTTASIILTQGGTATVRLAATLTNNFSLTGSSQADILTFVPAHLFTINVNAGSGDDSITSASGNDSLLGAAGNDTLSGLNGLDTLDGGTGIDALFGGNGNDFLFVRIQDSVFGGANDDLLSVTENLPAVLDGGTGIDILRFESSYDITGATITAIEQVNVNFNALMTATQLGSFGLVSGYSLGSTTGSVSLTQGGTATVTLASSLINGFTLNGSSQDDLITFNSGHSFAITVNAGFGNDSITSGSGTDVLQGNQGNDTLAGFNGNDTVNGGSGADLLIGGLGADSLTGGIGRDTFAFNVVADSDVATPDIITDFQGAGVLLGDIIDLAAIDANGAAVGLAAFIFNSVGLAGLSLVDSGTDTLVRGNTDGDAAFEFTIILQDGAVLAADYTAADFIL